jgi:predicted Zn-dependent protease
MNASLRLLNRLSGLVVLAMLVLATTGCGLVRAQERSLTRLWVSPEKEMALGAQFSGEIEGEYNLVNDPVVQAWVTRLGNELLQHSPETQVTFTFQVTDSQEVNAFAIPGGYCYVNLGLIMYADNEAQVAAVMGHEVNHVTMRHGVVALQRAVGIQAFSALAAASLEDEREAAVAVIATQAGGFLATRRFGRDDEREADTHGVEAMYRAGYDPREAARFFEKLNDLQGDRVPSRFTSLFGTHPPTAERIQRIYKQIEGYDLWSVELKADSPEFQAVRARLAQMYPAQQ